MRALLGSALAALSLLAADPEAPFLQKLDLKIQAIETIKGDPSIVEGTRRDRIKEQVAFANRDTRLFLEYCYAKSLPRFVNLASVEEARTDKQVGQAASGSGSTSLVSKAGAPGIFGMALENGGFAQSLSGTTVTFRGNLVGMTDMLAARGYLSSYSDDSPMTRILRRINASVSLDTSRPTIAGSSSGSSPVAAVQNQIDQVRQQLSGYSVRVDLWNRRDPRDPRNFVGMTAGLDDALQKLLADVDDAVGEVQVHDDYLAWMDLTADELMLRSGIELKATFFRRLDALCDLAHKLVPDFDSKLQKALATYQSVFDQRSTILKSLEKKPLLTAEYATSKFFQQPDVGTARLIFERQLGQTRVDLTANGALNWLHGRASNGVEGIRDWEFSGQADVPLGSRCTGCGGALGNPVLSFAAMVEKVKLQAPVTFGLVTITSDPGIIAIGQLKLVIPIKNTGLKIPLSLSFANRTELIQEKDIRGNFGLTFDFDTVAALFKK